MKPPVPAAETEAEELKTALREALDEWEGWLESELTGTKWYVPQRARIDVLRRLL